MSIHQTSAANVYITGTLTLLYDCFSLAMSYLPVISLPSSKYLSSIADMLLCKTTVYCFLILLINITCPFIFYILLQVHMPYFQPISFRYSSNSDCISLYSILSISLFNFDISLSSMSFVGLSMSYFINNGSTLSIMSG